jgi:hypothetical protein
MKKLAAASMKRDAPAGEALLGVVVTSSVCG